jgi:hypothetical protein
MQLAEKLDWKGLTLHAVDHLLYFCSVCVHFFIECVLCAVYCVLCIYAYNSSKITKILNSVCLYSQHFSPPLTHPQQSIYVIPTHNS